MKKIKFILYVFMLVSMLFLCTKVIAQGISEEEYLNKIGQLQRSGAITEAIKYNEEMLRTYSNSIKAYTSMALLLRNQGNFDEAIVNCKKAISLNPNPQKEDDKENVFQAHNVLADIYSTKFNVTRLISDLDMSIAELKKAIKIKPGSDMAHYTLGVLYSQKMMYREARAEFQKVIEIGEKGESKGVLAGYAAQALEKIDLKEQFR